MFVLILAVLVVTIAFAIRAQSAPTLGDSLRAAKAAKAAKVAAETPAPAVPTAINMEAPPVVVPTIVTESAGQ